MNCSQIEEYASLYVDGMLTEEEMINFNKHLETCENCSISVENLKILVSTVNEMEEVELPENFTLSLREKLQKEREITIKDSNHKKGNKIKGTISSWKVLSGIAAGFMIISMSMTLLEDVSFNQAKVAEVADEGISVRTPYGFDSNTSVRIITKDSAEMEDTAAAESEESKAFDREGMMAMTSSIQNNTSEEEEVSITSSPAIENRKIINTGRLYLETNEFDESMNEINRIVEESGGYYQSSDVQYRLFNKEKPEDSLRTSYLTLRVPKDSFDKVFGELKGLGIVINENTSAQDVTLTYRDIENEVLNLEVQEERLREILKKAEKVDDILRIEKELSRVRGQINSMKGSLKNYDQLITLSTIELEITEVKEQEMRIQSVNNGVWGRAKEGFVKSINQIIDFGQRSFIKLYGLIPWAIVSVIIILPGVKLGNKVMKKRRNSIDE